MIGLLAVAVLLQVEAPPANAWTVEREGVKVLARTASADGHVFRVWRIESTGARSGVWASFTLSPDSLDTLARLPIVGKVDDREPFTPEERLARYGVVLVWYEPREVQWALSGNQPLTAGALADLLSGRALRLRVYTAARTPLDVEFSLAGAAVAIEEATGARLGH